MPYSPSHRLTLCQLLSQGLSLSIATVTLARNCQTAFPLLPDIEQQVIRVLLGEQESVLRTRDLVVLETASAANIDFSVIYERARRALDPAPSGRNTAYGQAMADMLRKDGAAARIAEITNTSRPVHLVSDGTFRSIFSDDVSGFDTWLNLCERIPDATRFVTVSRVGLDSKATLAVVCYAVKQPLQSDILGFQLLRRESNQWFLAEFREAYGSEPRDTVIACKLRFYVAHSWARTDSPPLKLEVAKNTGTNLVCSVPHPFKLIETDPMPRDFAGWVFQVTEPSEHAGELLTAVLDDYPPVQSFRFGRRYELALPRKLIGDLKFRLRL